MFKTAFIYLSLRFNSLASIVLMRGGNGIVRSWVGDEPFLFDSFCSFTFTLSPLSWGFDASLVRMSDKTTGCYLEQQTKSLSLLCCYISHNFLSLFFFKYSKNSQKIYIFVLSNFSSTLAKALDCFHFYKMRVRVYSKPQVVKLKMTLVPQSHRIHCGSICTLVIFSPLMLFIMLASLSIDL